MLLLRLNWRVGCCEKMLSLLGVAVGNLLLAERAQAGQDSSRHLADMADMADMAGMAGMAGMNSRSR